MTLETEDVLCDQVGTLRKLAYLGDEASAHEGCSVAVIGRRFG